MKLKIYFMAVAMIPGLVRGSIIRETNIEKAHPLSLTTQSQELFLCSNKWNSQASQDKFVYTILYDLLLKQDGGYYLEIGAGEPIHINNSYFFEKELKWYGVSIDISESLEQRWNLVRKNPLLTEDATQSDYIAILQSFPKVIDYLSLDVDGYYDLILNKIPLNKYLFKVITIEHDFYRFGDIYRKREREILSSFGYHLLCSDVSNEGKKFEDWWIHPSVFPSLILSELSSLDLEAKDHNIIIETIRTRLCKTKLLGKTQNSGL